MSQPNLPLISIIIPYYNCEKYIAETLASVEAQTYPNIEVILVNDGSSKPSTAYIEALIQDKAYIQYFYQENKGVSSARNTGAKHAKGEFLLFLDADNKIHPDYLQKTAEVLSSNPNCKLVYTKAEFFEAQSGEWELPDYTNFKNLLLGNKIDTLALIRKMDFDALGGFDENLKSHEDWDYWIRLLQYGGEVIRIDEILFYYRKRFDKTSLTDNLIRNENENRESWQIIYSKHHDLFIKYQLSYWDLIHFLHQVETLSKDNQELISNNNSLDIQYQELNSQQANLESEYQQLYSQKINLENEYHQLNIQHTILNDNYQSLTLEKTKINQNIDTLQQDKIYLEQTIHGLNHHNQILLEEIQKENLKFKRFKKLWIIILLKPLIQIELGLHSINRYRKGFRKLKKQKGSYATAYQIIHNIYKTKGLKSMKKFLKDYNENKITFNIENIENQFNLKSDIIILTTKHTYYIAKLFQHSLEKISIHTKVIFEQPKNGFSDKWHIVICPQMFETLPHNYLAFQMEQSISSRWFTEEYFNRLKNAKFIFDYATPNLEYLQEKEIPFSQLYYLPVGILSSQELSNNSDNYEYDVAFYGDPNCERRAFFLEKLKEKFSVNVISEVFGDELYSLLNKSKIIVNIHYYENALLESTRLYECLSLNKLVISEKGSDQVDYDDLNDIIDFVEVGDIDGMISRIQYWLDSPNEYHNRLKNINYLKNQVSKFDFYFYRFLLSHDLIEFDKFYELCADYIQPKGDFWCLSLPESTLRRKDFQKDNQFNVWLFTGLRHHIGWVGCGLSYKFMTKRAEDLKLSQVTICEDDVLFPNNFELRYQHIKNALSSTKTEWDIFSGLIADLSQNANISISNITSDSEDFYNIDKLISMVFNIYNQTSYSKIYNWDENHRPHSSLSNTIDRYVQDCGIFKGVIVSPYLVGHKENLFSTLWNHSNIAYRDLINRSQQDLNRKIMNLKRKQQGKYIPKILLAMPDHVGVYTCIRNNLEYHGFEVTEALISGSHINYDFEKETKQSSLPIYDYALFIRSDLFVESGFLNKIKPYIKKGCMVAYQWDYMNRFPLAWDAVASFDKFFVFDTNDLKNNQTNFLSLTNFYFDYQLDKKVQPIYDFYFIGCHVEGRENEIISFAKNAEKNNWLLDFEIVAPSEQHVAEWKQIYSCNNIRIGTRFKTFQENLDNSLNSHILVDFKTPEQEGLSFRSFEALGYRKKLITTNSNISYYDFYHPNNIFIWDGKNLDGLKEFLELPYVDIDEEIRQKYSFKNWLYYVLNIQPHQKIILPK